MAIKVSLIIPNYNGKELLEKNLPFVLRASQDEEVIVVDDASTDNSVEFLKTNFPKIKIVCHQKNQRFAASCNSGVQAAQGDVVVLLNSDVQPEKGFLSPLINNFRDKTVFAVGCLEKDGQKMSGRGRMSFKKGLVLHWRAKDQYQKTTDWATGGSSAFDRRKWLAIGGMDTLFRPAYEEDRDLSYRALKHGWQVLFEPKSVVQHHHETTNIRIFGKPKMKIASFKNQFLFVWKNITDIRYLFSHLFWLPYHLLLTNLKTRGLLGIGFLWALSQLPELLRQRRKVRGLFVKSDKELI